MDLKQCPGCGIDLSVSIPQATLAPEVQRETVAPVVNQPAVRKTKRGIYFLYLFLFGLIAIASVSDNWESKYPVWFVVISGLSYALAAVGIILYAIRFSVKWVQRAWRVIAILFAAHIIAEGAMDQLNMKPHWVVATFIWIVGFTMFYPAFRANFHLAFPSLAKVRLFPRKTSAPEQSNKPFPVKRFVAGLLLLSVFCFYGAAWVGGWGMRIISAFQVEAFYQAKGTYPETLLEAGVDFKKIHYQKTSERTAVLVQKNSPWPFLYFYDSYEKRWYGGFHFGISSLLTDRYSGLCKQLIAERRFNDALAAAKKYEWMTQFFSKLAATSKPEAIYFKGYILGEMGNYHGAIESYQEAEKNFQITSFRDHEWALGFANNFGDLYVQFGDYKKAGEYYQRVLTYAAEHPDFKSPLLAQAYSGMGSVKTLENNFKDAAEYFQKTLELCKVLPGETWTLQGRALLGLASVKGIGTEYAEAEKYYDQAGAIFARHLPHTRQSLARLKQDYAGMEFRRKNLDKAERLLTEAIGLFGKHDTASMLDWSSAITSLAVIYFEKKESQKAAEMLEDLIDMMDEEQAPGGYYFQPMNNLAAIYTDMKKYEEAGRVWDETIEILEDVKSTDPNYYIEIHLKRAEIYALLNEPENAQKIIADMAAFAKEHPLKPEVQKKLDDARAKKPLPQTAYAT